MELFQDGCVKGHLLPEAVVRRPSAVKWVAEDLLSSFSKGWILFSKTKLLIWLKKVIVSCSLCAIGVNTATRSYAIALYLLCTCSFTDPPLKTSWHSSCCSTCNQGFQTHPNAVTLRATAKLRTKKSHLSQ